MQEEEVISVSKHHRQKHNHSTPNSSSGIIAKEEANNDEDKTTSQNISLMRHLRVKLQRYLFSSHHDSHNETAESPLETRIRTQVERFQFMLISQGYVASHAAECADRFRQSLLQLFDPAHRHEMPLFSDSGENDSLLPNYGISLTTDADTPAALDNRSSASPVDADPSREQPSPESQSEEPTATFRRRTVKRVANRRPLTSPAVSSQPPPAAPQQSEEKRAKEEKKSSKDRRSHSRSVSRSRHHSTRSRSRDRKHRRRHSRSRSSSRDRHHHTRSHHSHSRHSKHKH